MVPATRGVLRHKHPDVVIDEVRKIVDAGGVEVTLLGQNVTAYHHPRATFAELLRRAARMRDLRRGVVFLALGIATFLCSLFFDIDQVVNGLRATAVFPLMLGLAFLLVWKMNRD